MNCSYQDTGCLLANFKPVKNLTGFCIKYHKLYCQLLDFIIEPAGTAETDNSIDFTGLPAVSHSERDLI
jgi:hypothetical protein